MDDASVERLLDLDGEIMEVGGGFWVKFSARRVAVTAAKPHGIDYSICLFSPASDRLICYDNAHSTTVGSGPAKKRTAQNDHVHRKDKVGPYRYTNAESLLVDFWEDVYKLLAKEGVQ